MKINTYQLLVKHMESGSIYFPENKGPICEFRLTKGEIRDIICSEYGLRPKRTRVVKKYLKRIINGCLREVLENIKNGQFNKGIPAQVS